MLWLDGAIDMPAVAGVVAFSGMLSTAVTTELFGLSDFADAGLVRARLKMIDLHD